MGQLRSENRALEALHPIVVPDLVVVVARRASVFPQARRAFRSGGIIRDEGAGLAASAQVLPRVKAEAGHGTEGPDGMRPL